MTAVAWTDPAFQDVADFVRASAGLVFPPSRQGEVEQGTRKVMARAGLQDVREFLRRAAAEAPLLDALISEVTIGETYFFREPGHFAFVREEIAPEIRRLREPAHVLRVWSAGCASGEEAYSLAILFDELGLAGQSRILASDISRTQLARAREGVYGGWSLRGDGARLASEHLRRTGSRFQVSETIRRRVEFAYLNLAQDTYPTVATSTWGMDLVLCRNVLLYFDVDTTAAVARRLYACLAPGGYLIAGSSDPLLGGYAAFDTLTTTAGVIYRKAPEPRRTHPQPTAASPVLATGERRDVTTAGRDARMGLAQPAALAPQPGAAAGASITVRRGVARKTSQSADLAGVLADANACASHLRALADLGDVTTAAALAAKAVVQHPTSEEIGFLHAIFLMNLDCYDEAERALKRVLYLNRSSIIAQFALGSTLQRLGKVDAAVRAFRNARRAAALRPADEPIPLTDGERAGRVVAAIDARLTSVGAQRELGE